MAGAASSCKEGKRGGSDAVCAALRVVQHMLSLLLSLLAICFVCHAIWTGHSVMPGPLWFHLIVFLLAVGTVAHLEGLQVAVLKVVESQDSGAPGEFPRAEMIRKWATEGRNLQRFLVGRQLYLLLAMLMGSQVWTFRHLERPTDCGVIISVLWYWFVETGLPSAFAVLACGQAAMQVIAARYPRAYCNWFGSWVLFQTALGLEYLGVAHFSWLLSALISRACCLDAARPTASVEPAREAPLEDRLEAGSCRKAKEVESGETGSSVDLPASKASDGAVTAAPAVDAMMAPAADSMVAPTELPPVPESFLIDLASLQLSWRSDFQKPDEAEELFVPASAVAQVVAAESEKLAAAASSSISTPQQFLEHLLGTGQEVPRYLLAPEHPLHLPAHLFACELMKRQMAKEARWFTPIRVGL